MNDKKLTEGNAFETNNNPYVDRMVVLEIGAVSGYRAAYVAECDHSGNWDANWLKASYIHDEVNLDAADPVEDVDEDRLEQLRDAFIEGVSAPSPAEEVPALD